jgi:uncharacterized protein YacL (UPF0231 family)
MTTVQEYRFYRDEEGNPRVHVEESSSKLLASFLEEDVQESSGVCLEILSAIKKVNRGDLPAWRQVGNAHTVSLSLHEATITSLFDASHEPCRMGLVQLQGVLESWLRFIRVA